MALSRSSITYQSGRGTYSAASRSIDSPEGVNNYLRTILDPAHYTSGIPDDDQTRRVIKSNTISATLRVPEDDREIMILYTPKSKGPVVSVYVRPTNTGPWGFLTQIDKSDPLYQSYSTFRNVAGNLQIYSATLPAGAFSINGSINGVYSTAVPPFKNINFDQILSYAAGPAFVSVGDNIVDGQVLLAVPNGKNPYTPPLPPLSDLFNYPVSPLEIGVPTAAVPYGAAIDQTVYDIPGTLLTTTVAPGFVINSIITIDSTTTPALKDPLSGWFKATVAFQVDATFTYDARVFLSITTDTVDPNTWNTTTLIKRFPLGMIKLNNQPYPDIFYVQTFDWLLQPGQISRVNVILEYTTPLANQSITVTGRKMTFQNYSLFSEESQPVSISIIQGLDAGTQLKLVGVSVDECVPKAELSRDLTAVPGIDDDLEAEIAEARLGAGDFKMVLNRSVYNGLIAGGQIERMSTGMALYNAASMGSYVRKLRGRWDALSPGQQQALKTVGSSLIGATNTFTGGALTPFINAANAYPYHAATEEYENTSPLLSPEPPEQPRMRTLLAKNQKEGFNLMRQFCPKFAVQAYYEDKIFRVSPNGRVFVAAPTVEEAHDFLKICLCGKGYSASSEGSYPFSFDPTPGEAAKAGAYKGKSAKGPVPIMGESAAYEEEEEGDEPESFSPPVVPAFTTQPANTTNVSSKNLFMLLPPKDQEGAPILTVSVARYARPPQILDLSDEPVTVAWKTVTSGNLTIHFLSEYFEKNGALLTELVRMAADSGERGSFYVSTTRVVPDFVGDSWQFAWGATILGFSVPNAVITGGLALRDGIVTITPVARVAEKMNAAKDMGLKLLFPQANIVDMLEGFESDEDKLVTPAFYWKGRALPANTRAVAMGVVQDLCLFTKVSTLAMPRGTAPVGGTQTVVPPLPATFEAMAKDFLNASNRINVSAGKNAERMITQLSNSYAAYLTATKAASPTERQAAVIKQFRDLVRKIYALTTSRRSTASSMEALQEQKGKVMSAPPQFREDGTRVGSARTHKAKEQRKRRKERLQQSVSMATQEGSEVFGFDFT